LTERPSLTIKAFRGVKDVTENVLDFLADVEFAAKALDKPADTVTAPGGREVLRYLDGFENGNGTGTRARAEVGAGNGNGSGNGSGNGTGNVYVTVVKRKKWDECIYCRSTDGNTASYKRSGDDNK
jgi:hypothetical protein